VRVKKPIDAEFTYVAGPMRPGDEHPGHRGWYYTGMRDHRGNLLWYRPPGRWSLWVRRVALVAYLALMALGVFGGLVVEKPL